jgi:hypothetical protein
MTTDHRRPVDRSTRIEDLDEGTDRLVRRGVLRPAAARLDLEYLLDGELAPDPERRVLRALLDDRGSG